MPPENYKGNAVADAFFRNKLAQPKQTIVPAIIMEILVNLSKKEICREFLAPATWSLSRIPARNRAERSKAWSIG